MPANGLSVGHDVTVNVISPLTGTLITFGNITDFDASPETKAIESSPLSAPPVFGDIPHGWKLSFTIDRIDATVDDFFAQLEAAYWAGANVLSGTVMEYIQEKNGTVSQYSYTGVAFKLDNAGQKKSQEKITMKISGRASLRVKII